LNLRTRLKNFTSSSRKIRHEITGFGIAGVVALTVDLTLFNTLIALGAGSSIANLASSLVGVVFNFLINYRTFVGNGRSAKVRTRSSLKFSLVTGASFFYLLLGFELYLVFFEGAPTPNLSLARVLLIGSGTVARFLLFRHWVFKSEVN
jgi:putative flippase GtrA